MECGPWGPHLWAYVMHIGSHFWITRIKELKRFDQELVPETDPDKTLTEDGEDYPPASQNPSSSSSSSHSQQQGEKCLFQAIC